MKIHYFNALVAFRAHIYVSDESGTMTKEEIQEKAQEILDNGDYDLGSLWNVTTPEYLESEEIE